MKKTTNAIQETYMIAQAQLETLEAALAEKERQYLIDQGARLADGTTPERIYCILEDEALFERMSEGFDKIIESSGEWAKILEARQDLKLAEAALIEWGLSITPADVRATLQEAAKTNVTIRWEIRDLALKLDVSTIRR